MSNLYRIPEGPGERAIKRLTDKSNGVAGGEPESLFVSLDPLSNKRDKETISAGLRFTSLEALLAEPIEQTPFIAGGMLPAGGISILGAKPKVGKSTLARNLALSVARGRLFLDRETTQGVVLYVALEEKRSEVADDFRSMGGTNESLQVHTGIAPDKFYDNLIVSIARHKACLAVVDPMIMAVRIKDTNDYAEVYDKLGPYVLASREFGCHIMFLHHMNKMDDLLGSIGFKGVCDTIMLMRKHPETSTRTLETEQRYGTDLAATVIAMDPDTKITSPMGQLAEVQLHEVEDQIVDFLKDVGEPVTERQIWEHMKGDNARTAKALRRLVEYTTVEREGLGKAGNPYLYSLWKREEAP